MKKMFGSEATKYKFLYYFLGGEHLRYVKYNSMPINHYKPINVSIEKQWLSLVTKYNHVINI